MAELVSKALLKVVDLEAILEDGRPELSMEKEMGAEEYRATIRLKQSTHVGAKVVLAVHEFRFDAGRVSTLRDAGVPADLIEGLQQPDDAPAVAALELRRFLAQVLDKRRGGDLVRLYYPALCIACGVNSSIDVNDWDPNELFGLMSGGNAWHMSNRTNFQREILTFLCGKVEHESLALQPGGECFIATAAAGDAADPCVVALRRFRDKRLVCHRAGRAAVAAYGIVGPPLAASIRGHRLAQRITYSLLVRPAARLVQRFDRPAGTHRRGGR